MEKVRTFSCVVSNNPSPPPSPTPTPLSLPLKPQGLNGLSLRGKQTRENCSTSRLFFFFFWFLHRWVFLEGRESTEKPPIPTSAGCCCWPNLKLTFVESHALTCSWYRNVPFFSLHVVPTKWKTGRCNRLQVCLFTGTKSPCSSATSLHWNVTHFWLCACVYVYHHLLTAMSHFLPSFLWNTGLHFSAFALSPSNILIFSVANWLIIKSKKKTHALWAKTFSRHRTMKWDWSLLVYNTPDMLRFATAHRRVRSCLPISPRQATAQTAESREGFYAVVLKTTEQLLHVINFTPFEWTLVESHLVGFNATFQRSGRLRLTETGFCWGGGGRGGREQIHSWTGI